MDAKCIDGRGDFKLCPYRIYQVEYKAMVIGQGDIISQTFYPCAGEECIAYHIGVCLRVHEVLTTLK